MSKQALVGLQSPRHDHQGRDERFRQTSYGQSAPFFENPRGVLIHRVRALYRLTFLPSEHREPWHIVEYWCENSARPKESEVDDGLLFDPGVKLICARCEALAVAKGERTSSELVGRHVCTGVCRPVNTCHPNESN